MQGTPTTLAIITPYAWSQDNPVNEYIRDLADESARNPDLRLVILAPSMHPAARKATRKALRELAHGAGFEEIASVSALHVSPEIPVPVLSLGLPVGKASVAMRSAIKLVYDALPIDAVVVQDPLESDFSRVATLRWDGFTCALFHSVPTAGLLSTIAAPHRDRILDQIDLRLCAFPVLIEPLSKVLVGDSGSITPISTVRDMSPVPTGADPATETGSQPAVGRHVVLVRSPNDDNLLRSALRHIAQMETVPESLTVLSRWTKVHRPTLPKKLRPIAKIVHAKSRESSDEVVRGATTVIAFPGIPDRLKVEIAAHGRAILTFDETDSMHTLSEMLGGARTGSAAHADGVQPPFGTAPSLVVPLLTQLDALRARRHEYDAAVIAPPPARECLIDLHMHTSHSWDCATDPEVLLYAAREVGLTAIAVTDHNEVSGALACAELADEYGIQVIVGEEVKTSQGEVIGLFLAERIEPGLSWHETILRIRQQDGLVYVPHPFDRLHTIPDAQTLRDTIDDIDLFEVYNARLTFEQYNRDALRFARKYNLLEGAGSDAHVPQGLGTAAVHMPAWGDPESFLTALRQGDIIRRPKSLMMLQGRKFIHTVTGKTKRSPVTHAEPDA